MKRAELKALIALTVLFFFWMEPAYYAQADPDDQQQQYRIFTDKSGKTVEATILAVSSDKSKLRIRRKDGVDFDFPILTLSLDDQQYIKDWLKEAPGSTSSPAKTDYNLEVKAVKHLEGIDRQEPRGYDVKWATHNTNYGLNIKNMSREKLTGASIEYYILISQGLYVEPYDEDSPARKQYGVDSWWYSHDSSSMKKNKGRRSRDKPVYLIHGKADIDELPFNYDTEILTETFPLREIEGGSQYTAQDIVIGVIARITDSNNNEVMVYRSTTHPLVSKDWDTIAQMPKGDPLGRMAMENSAIPRN